MLEQHLTDYIYDSECMWLTLFKIIKLIIHSDYLFFNSLSYMIHRIYKSGLQII